MRLPFLPIPMILAAVSGAAAQSPSPQLPSPLPIDTATLRPREDSFSIRFRGAPIGYTKGRLEETAEGLRYTEETRIPPLVDQSTAIELDRVGTVLRVSQQGRVQGEATTIEVEYRGGRVTGKARTMAQDGPKEVAIDTTVAPGTVDENAIQMLLPTLPWSSHATWKIGVFSSGLGEYRVGTLQVAGIESVTLDSGPVEAFRAEWTGLAQAVTFWVAREAPHRLLKIVLSGTPLEILAPR